MAIDFPSSPTNLQRYTDTTSGQSFTYYSTPGAWKKTNTGYTGSVGYAGSLGYTGSQGVTTTISDYGMMYAMRIITT